MRFSTLFSTALIVSGLLFSNARSSTVRAQLQPLIVRGEMTDEDPAINNEDDHPFDVYRVTGTAGTPVTLTLESTDYDPYIILFFAGENGLEEVARSNDIGPNNTNSQLFGELPSTGKYTIIMTTAEPRARGKCTLTIEGL